MPVILYTDALIYLLLVLASSFVFYASRHEHLRAPWRRVARSRIAMGSAVVLGFYLVIGVLDSLHYRPALSNQQPGAATQYSNEVLSVFDWLVSPLRLQQEKTYSAPFATRLYVKETVDLDDGGQARVYPRLRYGGSHLEDPDRGRAADVLKRFGRGAAEATLAWAVVVAAFACGLARRRGTGFRAELRRIFGEHTEVPWAVIFGVSWLMLVLTFAGIHLGVKYHVLGTDKVGQDVFFQALKSIRTGLVIGTLTTLIMLPFAVFLGIMAGYFKGWVDDVIQYLYTTLNSIPSILLVAAAVLMLHVHMDNHPEAFSSVVERADLRLLFLCIILGVTSWTGLCRLLRGESLKLREIDYIQASSAFGVGGFRIMLRHILPNVMHIVLISVVLDFSGLVLAEAVLSYVNIGVDPTTNSWGNMINTARLEMAREPIVWWSLSASFLFMFSLVLAANLFSDVVRDAFDPRLGR